MLRTSGILIGVSLLGLFVSGIAGHRLEHLIQRLLSDFTDLQIIYYGSGLHRLTSPYYQLGLVILFLLVWTSWEGTPLLRKIMDGLLVAIIFFTSIVAISWLISSEAFGECRACEYSHHGINYDYINYDIIVLCSLLLSMIPSIGRIMMRRTRNAASAQQRI